MSVENLILLALLFGAYRLGAYNATYPGRTWESLRTGATRVWRWMGQ